MRPKRLIYLRTHKSVLLKNTAQFKEKLLLWSERFNEVVWLDSNFYNGHQSQYDAILAVDAFTSLKTDFTGAFDQLKEYQTVTKDWLFGYLSYDLKNDVEDLTSNNIDSLEFPELFFFQPKKIFLLKGNRLNILYLNYIVDEFNEDLEQIKNVRPSTIEHKNEVKIQLRIHKDEYFNKVGQLLHHIHRGDIYEANFCQEFYAENTVIDPVETYRNLNEISKPPFATFLNLNGNYLLSASPERYLMKQGSHITSQPIKGTAKRSANATEDIALKQQLEQDIKERSENIMIVDLVRNDLAKTAIKGSVKVEELCKVYTFDQVHQMISTVTSEVEHEVHPVEILKSTFPMGSMTGAPKISAMKIIEELEVTKRGLYSGAVGYFSPEGDFDFNVVIRSILYNSNKKYVSYSVGGAITAKSDPLREYEECLVKAKAMRQVLEN